MDDWRSRSYGDGRMEMDVYGNNNYKINNPPSGMHDMRCYSTPHSSSDKHVSHVHKDPKPSKKGKHSSSSSWSLSDPELQRKKRVAGYKVYAVEGNIKGSIKKSFRWLKDRYTQVFYGWK